MSNSVYEEMLAAATADLSIARDCNGGWAVVSSKEANWHNGGGMMVVYSGLSTPEAAEDALNKVAHQMVDSGSCYGPSEVPMELFEEAGRKTIAKKAEAERTMDEIKDDLIVHYRTHDAKRFFQFDGSIDAGVWTGRDETGKGAESFIKLELMHGADVRVLIPANGETTPGEIVQLLRIVSEQIESGTLARLDSLALTPGAHSRSLADEEVPF